LQRAFGESTVHYKVFHEQYVKHSDPIYESYFMELAAILAAAKEDYSGGYLFNLKSLVKAEVLDDATEQAHELLTAGYKDPACVVCGISLEVAIKEMASRQGITLAKLEKMNADLCKAGVYNMAKQKQITAWADLRNKAAHGEWNAYNAADVQEMLDGIKRFIADYL
jgi:hypothetical protein